MPNKDPEVTSTTIKSQGRPGNQSMLPWFEMLCRWIELEADAELYTVAELHAKMAEFSRGSETYSPKRLKQKVQEHYKQFIFFAEIEGRRNVVCFRNMANYIINGPWHSDKKGDIEDEAGRIVTAAAKL